MKWSMQPADETPEQKTRRVTATRLLLVIVAAIQVPMLVRRSPPDPIFWMEVALIAVACLLLVASFLKRPSRIL